MTRGIRAALYVIGLVLVGAWLFLPGSNALPLLREWFSAAWAVLRATPLGPFLPSMDLSVLGASLLTVTSAAVYSRVAVIAVRSYLFVHRRRKAAQVRAHAAVV